MKILVGQSVTPYLWELDTDTGDAVPYIGISAAPVHIDRVLKLGLDVVLTNNAIYAYPLPEKESPLLFTPRLNSPFYSGGFDSNANNYLIAESTTSPYLSTLNPNQKLLSAPRFYASMNWYVSDLVFSPNALFLACVGAFSSNFCIWDSTTGVRRFTFTGTTTNSTLSRVDWSPDGRFISHCIPATNMPNSLVEYDQSTDTFIQKMTGDTGLTRRDVKFNSSSSYVFFVNSSSAPFIEIYQIADEGVWQQVPFNYTMGAASYSLLADPSDPNVMYAAPQSTSWGVQRLYYSAANSEWRIEPVGPAPVTGYNNITFLAHAVDYPSATIHPIASSAATVSLTAALPPTRSANTTIISPAPTVSFQGSTYLIAKAVFNATIDTPTTLLTGKKYVEELILQTNPRMLDSDLDIRTTYLVPFMLENGFSFETDSEITRFIQMLLGSSSSAASSSTVGFKSQITFQEAIEVLDFSLIEQALVFLEIMGFDSSESISHAQILALVSDMFARDSSQTAVSYGVNFAAALTLRDAFASGYVLSLESSAELTATFQEIVNHILTEITAFSLVPEERLNLNVQMLVLSDATTTDSVQTQLSTTMLYQSMLNGLSVFRVGDDMYEGWVLNLNDAEEPEVAFSNYTNYPFTSIVEFNGKNYGVAEDGIYLLEGPDDAGQAISASIRTGLINFNAQQVKDAKNFFLGYTSDGQIVLKVVTISGSKRREDWYKVKAPEVMDYGVARTKLHRGLRSSYWQFELVSPEGADFQFDSAVFEYQVLSRRIRK